MAQKKNIKESLSIHSVEKTGTGFIKTGNTNNVPFSLDSDSTTDLHTSCKGNPATNDWIPASGDMADFISDKPSRSDN